ncbi:MAG TPA: cyclic nucleotide-binding domain-containing protein [Pyrinomonadaceae bacterium]
MSIPRTEKRRTSKNRNALLEALSGLEILSDLVKKTDKHYTHELDLEIIVYGRAYAGGPVGPYARLWVYESGEHVISEGDWAGNSFYVLVEGDLQLWLDEGKEFVRCLRKGELFGEMAVIEGDARSTTVIVPEGRTATVIELQRPALRLLRELPNFARIFDAEYRQHSLQVVLDTVQDASGGAFDEKLLAELGEIARFKLYRKHHLLLRQGQPIDSIYFINKGWVEVRRGGETDTRGAAGSDKSLTEPDVHLLGPGNCAGLEVFQGRDAWPHTVVMQARTEVLEIPVEELRARPQLCEVLLEKFSGFSDVDEGKLSEPVADKDALAAARREITTGIVDASNLLVMDMALCVRCGNCSLACHKVHGQSRLVRRGIHIERPKKPQAKTLQHVLAPAVCLHCLDPECLTGCPTGAIARRPDKEIDIHKSDCIGCGDCATQCPYNAISMISTKPLPARGKLAGLIDWLKLTTPEMPPPNTDDKKLLAVKCNLCEGTKLNPEGKSKKAYSCEENCPTGALLRVNPREYFSETKNLIGIIYRDQTQAIGRNIHLKDNVARLWHGGGLLATALLAAVALWAATRFGLDQRLGATRLSVRWLTGYVGFASVIGAMLYLLRKQVYKRRRGPLRYWRLAHVYLGSIALVVLLVHGGWRSGGLLTSALMVAFDLTILSGLAGALIYLLAPRLLTRIEGEPLLLDDLLARRAELRNELSLIKTSDEKLKRLLRRELPRRLMTLRCLISQYTERAELKTFVDAARREFGEHAERLRLSAESRRALDEAVTAAATLKRVEALIYLHRLLKLWLAPHVVSTSVMLVLMAAHIYQVFNFAAR